MANENWKRLKSAVRAELHMLCSEETTFEKAFGEIINTADDFALAEGKKALEKKDLETSGPLLRLYREEAKEYYAFKTALNFAENETYRENAKILLDRALYKLEILNKAYSVIGLEEAVTRIDRELDQEFNK